VLRRTGEPVGVNRRYVHMIVLATIVGALTTRGRAGPANHDESRKLNEAADRRSTGLAVILEFVAPLRRAERRALSDVEIDVADYMGNNRYLALLPDGLSLAALQQTIHFLRAVEPLTITQKLGADLRTAKVPAHARVNGRVKVHVWLFSVTETIAKRVLRRHSDVVRHVSDAWEVEIDERRLENLGAEPIVKRIEASPDPRLL
jgi:hypothetical protein